MIQTSAPLRRGPHGPIGPHDRSRVEARNCGLTALGACLASALAAPEALAQSTQPAAFAEGNPFLRWLWLSAGIFVIWAFFYWYLYPRLLPHFGEDGSRAIFWPGLALYVLTWVHLSSYLIFTYGFFYLWLQWSALALIGLVSLWFLVSFSRRG